MVWDRKRGSKFALKFGVNSGFRELVGWWSCGLYRGYTCETHCTEGLESCDCCSLGASTMGGAGTIYLLARVLSICIVQHIAL